MGGVWELKLSHLDMGCWYLNQCPNCQAKHLLLDILNYRKLVFRGVSCLDPRPHPPLARGELSPGSQCAIWCQALPAGHPAGEL